MTSFPPYQPQRDPAQPMILAPGDIVHVEPKNPFTSTTGWGIVVVVTTALVNKYAPAEIRDAVLGQVLQLVAFVAGLGMAAWGRWRATRPLGFADVKRAVVKLLPLVLLLPLAGGCAEMNAFLGLPAEPSKLEQTPSDVRRADQAIVAVDTAIKVLNQLQREHYVSQALHDRIDPFVHGAANAAVALRSLALAKDEKGFAAKWVEFNRQYDEVVRGKLEAQSIKDAAHSAQPGAPLLPDFRPPTVTTATTPTTAPVAQPGDIVIPP